MSSDTTTPFVPDEDLFSKLLLRHSDGSSTLIVPWWRLEKKKNGLLVRHYADSKSEVFSYQQVLDQTAACSEWYEAELYCKRNCELVHIPFCLGHAADFEVARMCLLEYLDSIQFYMNRFFNEIDRALDTKQEEFDKVWRKELLRLVRIAFYNTLVMLLWILSFPLLTRHLPFFVVPAIYAFLYFVAHDLLGASWGTLWATICTIASKDSPLRRKLTHSERNLNDAREDWNALKQSATKRHAELTEMIQQGTSFDEGLDGEMSFFGFRTSVWEYLPRKLSWILFGEEETARFMDSVDFDWGALYN